MKVSFPCTWCLSEYGHLLPNFTLTLMSLSRSHATSIHSAHHRDRPRQTAVMTTFTSHVLTRGIWACTLSCCCARWRQYNVPVYCTCAINMWQSIDLYIHIMSYLLYYIHNVIYMGTSKFVIILCSVHCNGRTSAEIRANQLRGRP